jgi:general secretion pathway protein A
MFLQFFGLKDNPFKLTFDLNGIFIGKHHEEALAHLRYAAAEGEGFTVITGLNGMGKSTVCRFFVESINNSASVAFLSSPIPGPTELLQRMNRSFGIAVGAQTAHELTGALNRFLMQERIAGRKVIVFIDDAQILSPAVLEQIRLISNLETTRDKLIQIVLVGEPELMQLLNSHQLRQMGQRVSVRYEIGPLSLDETAAYIQHRLSLASTGAPLQFRREAVRKIFRHAGGNPRRINIACSTMLAAAFKLGQKEMTGELAQAVIRDLRILEGRSVGTPALARWRIPAAAAGVLVLLGGIAFFAFQPAPQRLAPEPLASEFQTATGSGIEDPTSPDLPPNEPATPAVTPSAVSSPEPPVELSDSVKKPVMTHSVQVGAYRYPENAQQVTAQLNAKGYSARIMKITDAGGRIWYTVRIGDHPSRQAAQAQADEYTRREQKQSVVRPIGVY